MKNESRAKIYFFVFWFFLIVTFIGLAFFVLTEATGYRLNLRNFNIEMTGLISLDGFPKDVEISVNGKIQENGLPLKLPKIFPGQYEINISKDGYSSWSRVFSVAGGQAYEEKKLYLYYLNPTIVETTSFSIEQISNYHESQANKVTVENNEIWYQEKLVSRFSSELNGAILTSDKKHIIFQLGKELRVVELNGKNNTKLIDLPTTNQVAYAWVSENKIAYVYEDKVYEAQIR